jgi:hypothetical protein
MLGIFASTFALSVYTDRPLLFGLPEDAFSMRLLPLPARQPLGLGLLDARTHYARTGSLKVRLAQVRQCNLVKRVSWE